MQITLHSILNIYQHLYWILKFVFIANFAESNTSGALNSKRYNQETESEFIHFWKNGIMSRY